MDARIIIVGGGCAGMQLINSLLKLPHTLTGDILLIEKETQLPQKSWCFWSKAPTIYDFLISKTWPMVQFKSPNTDICSTIAPYQYHYISSEDFFDYHCRLIENSSRIRTVYEEVRDIGIDEEGGYWVKTANNQYRCSKVFNSRPGQMNTDKHSVLLWQHFKGWFIKTEQPVFRPEVFRMMDFEVPQQGAVHFVYVLPFSETEALVEFTAFSAAEAYTDESYENYLRNYIFANWNTAFEIIKRESGKIPMTDYGFERAQKDGIINIGAAAGAIKPSTGYAFSRMMKDTQLLVAHIEQNLKRGGKWPVKRFGLYDKLLLDIIKHQPGQVSLIMKKLFSRNDFSKILSFLDESTSMFDEISIFSSLPKGIFLRSLAKHVFSK